jgi:hypothetical protein
MDNFNRNGHSGDDEGSREWPIIISEADLEEESVEGVILPEIAEQNEEAKALLVPVKESMEAAGFYAYSTLNQDQRLEIASDDEDGRFDIWVEDGAYIIKLWASSPGLFMDEENQWRRRAMERLARITIPRVAQGQLAAHQEAMWDEEDKGVAVRLTYRLPLSRAVEAGPFIRQHIPELTEVLEFVERQVGS